MEADLQFAPSKVAVVSRDGSRQEVVDRLVEAWDNNLTPPSLEVEPSPRRLELERELKRLPSAQIDRYQSMRETVEAEYRRPFEDGLAAAEDEEDRAAITAEMQCELSEKHDEMQLEAHRRISPIADDPRTAVIEAELAKIRLTDQQRAKGTYLKLASSMRHALEIQVTPDVIMQSLDRLADQHKRPSTIRNLPTYLSVMAEEIELEGFCPAVVAKAVRASARKYEWMPSTKEFLDECREIARSLWVQVWLMESKDPIEYSDLLWKRLESIEDDKREAEREKVKRLAYNKLKAFNGRDKAPGKYR